MYPNTVLHLCLCYLCAFKCFELLLYSTEIIHTSGEIQNELKAFEKALPSTNTMWYSILAWHCSCLLVFFLFSQFDVPCFICNVLDHWLGITSEWHDVQTPYCIGIFPYEKVSKALGFLHILLNSPTFPMEFSWSIKFLTTLQIIQTMR